MAAIEALASGLPVISTNVYGIPELVQDGVEGILVSPGDEKALAQAIETLANNPGLRQKMGQNGRLKIETEFNIKKSAERLCTLFFDRSRNQYSPRVSGV